MTRIGSIALINRYPVKSLQGEQLASAEIDERGISGDRRLALRDLTTGKVISAKQPRHGIKLLTCRATTGSNNDVHIEINSSTYSSAECGSVFSELLGVSVQVVRATNADEVYESEWPELPDMALSNITLDLSLAKGTFADLAPLHLVATSSITHLAALAENSEIDVQRFRPSVLIETDPISPPFVENEWVGATASIGTAEITFGLASPRCIMTTLAQGSLPRDPAVLQTIAEHNRRDFGGFGNFACLGIYAEVTTPGVISVGDPIVLQR